MACNPGRSDLRYLANSTTRLHLRQEIAAAPAGVTSDLMSRLHPHRTHAVASFIARCHATRLVHFEETDHVHVAKAREKQIKGCRRSS